MPALPPPPLVLRAEEPGFKSLFDGSEPDEQVSAHWQMVGEGRFEREGRSLIAKPGKALGLFYYTQEQFDDFVLRLDFLLTQPRGDNNDNSGIHLRFRNPLTPILPGTPRTESADNPANVAVDTGYEVQIDEEARGDRRRGEADGYFYNRTGAIYKITARGNRPGEQDYHNDQVLAAWRWHRFEICARARSYEVFLNGRLATCFTPDPRDPREPFRGRRKSEDPDSGFIGLQAHTGEVAFANLRIKML